MVYQHLGNTGLMVSRLSYGAWITFGKQINVDQAYEIMKRYCIERGVNFFDNAEAYANGVAETMMGNATKNIPNNARCDQGRLSNYNKNLFRCEATIVLSKQGGFIKKAYNRRIETKLKTHAT